jgi:hypothetical protein
MNLPAAQVPIVGMGATILGYSDRHAATVVRVSKNGREIDVVEDVSTRIDKNGMSEDQEYEYSSGNGSPMTFTLRKNNRWVRGGESMRHGSRLTLGVRDSYYDYSF